MKIFIFRVLFLSITQKLPSTSLLQEVTGRGDLPDPNDSDFFHFPARKLIPLLFQIEIGNLEVLRKHIMNTWEDGEVQNTRVEHHCCLP